MATGAQTWSTSAASNNSADSSVNWAEGMAPSAVNNSARAEMASAAMWIGDNSGTLATSGTTAAYTVTSKQVSTAVVDGYTIAVKFHATNDASATLNVDGVAAKALQIVAGTNLSGGEFAANTIGRFTYSSGSTAWILNGYYPSAANALSVKSIATSSNVVATGSVSGTSGTFTGATAASSSLVTNNLTAGTLTVTGLITGGSFSTTKPTVQRFTSTSSSTYITPAGASWIRVRMVGGGGGAGAVTSNSGSSGTDTTFSNWTAIHGGGGGTSGNTPGIGGTGGTDGTGTKVHRQDGQSGSHISLGGNSFLGGGGWIVNTASTGRNAVTNSGGGGSAGQGGGSYGSGGGGGEYVEFFVTTLSSQYAVIVGAGGTGGAAGTQAGGSGAAGVIIVEEYYI